MMLNKMGLAAYPEEIKELAFCNWRLEKMKDGPRKVPYNPRTGYRASAKEPDTFADLETALRVVARYDGVGIRIDGKIGCIDIDDCVLEDGSLTDIANAVLALLPDTFVELSPSGQGLHLFFIVPDDFVFDSDEYYINNRKVGMEIYVPSHSHQFVTITGNMFRDGSLSVSAEALYTVLDTYMKRPGIQHVQINVPEGGSVLTDAEVIYKASNCPTGEKFMTLYQGDWHDLQGDKKDDEWTHSEADMSFCRILAFWCRGDMEQMDRIFRESALMRDKWDRRQSGSTYGQLQMRKAISYCTEFYEPMYHDSAEEDFADLNDETEDHVEILDSLFSSDISIDLALSDSFLTEAAWAYQNDMPRYVKLKGKIPKEIGIRNFEREMKRHITPVSGSTPVSFLSLTGISTPDMFVPENWIVDDGGIRHMEMIFGELKPVRISSEPVFVSAKLVNVDEGTEKLEVTFRRNGAYKTLIAPRADMLNKNAIIKYADDGFPVSSGTAGTMTKYLAEMESVNNKVIPIRRSIRRAGWIGKEFYPYSLKNGIAAQTDGNETERILAALKTGGSEATWTDVAVKARRMPFARSMLAASFASPLLEKLQHRVIYYHNWYGTRSGKTATLKLAMSVWGNPAVLVSKYFSTIVGMERWSGTLKHLPFAMDELQTLNQKRLSVNDIVYTLGNGSGKTRGRVGAGLQKVEEWRNCILSTGEMPMSTENSMDGVNTRLMELYACPLSPDGTGDPDDALAMELHKVCEQNYGFAGEKYICFIVSHLDSLKADYERMQAALESGNPQRDNVAVLALADYYSSVSVFGLTEDKAFSEAVELGKAIMKNLEDNVPKSTVDAAWDFVCGWIASNKAHFGGNGTLYEPSPVYGQIEKDHVYVIVNELNTALDTAGYSHRKCIKGFQEKGYIESFMDSEGKKRSQTGKSIKGILSRVYSLKLNVKADIDQAAFEDDFLR